MTEQQLMTYSWAALAVIAIWIGIKVAAKILKVVFFVIALLALVILLLKVI